MHAEGDVLNFVVMNGSHHSSASFVAGLFKVAGKFQRVVEIAAFKHQRDAREIVMLGSGDSWFAGLACRLGFETYAGLPAEAIQAYEYAAYARPAFDSRTAAIVTSGHRMA